MRSALARRVEEAIEILAEPIERRHAERRGPSALIEPGPPSWSYAASVAPSLVGAAVVVHLGDGRTARGRVRQVDPLVVDLLPPETDDERRQRYETAAAKTGRGPLSGR